MDTLQFIVGLGPQGIQFQIRLIVYTATNHLTF